MLYILMFIVFGYFALLVIAGLLDFIGDLFTSWSLRRGKAR